MNLGIQIPKNVRGFSLIELLVVVAIIGILASIGTVGYQTYINGARAASAGEERERRADKINNDVVGNQTGVTGTAWTTCLAMVTDQVAEFNATNASNPYGGTDPIFLNGHTESRNGSNTIDLLAGQQLIMCSRPCAAPEAAEVRVCTCNDETNGCTSSTGTPPAVACPTPVSVSSC